ncbi:uncharacterized protein LOC132732365 [Ruditapes philippinarum]|uniref:uncharacterized protein LOC132732365 n=1 Tax=Ruditapes philippinarum TaxID=129788 RepID=UPI00295BDE67|nr:uncharacterized protein LOC132732365 [Ruditapes philippinarum]
MAAQAEQDTTEMSRNITEKQIQSRDARKSFVEEELNKAEKSNFTSKEIQATIKVIEKNIELIRHHCDKIIELGTTQQVAGFIKRDEKWFLDQQKRVAMLCENRDDIKIRQNRTKKAILDELKVCKYIKY